MPISVNQNISKAPAFGNAGGLSPLNSGFAQQNNTPVNTVTAPMQQFNPQAQTGNQPISTSNSAYMPGVGAVPSGYFLPGEESHGSEDHIIKKTPLTGARIMADKIAKDIFVYAPKGMQGSKNSNFYEYLSLGIIPYIAGSAGLIATSVAASRFFNPNEAKASKMMSKNVVGGVLLYAAMKWLGAKVMNKGTQLMTGIDMDMPYKKVISELPENGRERVVTEFHKVFESVDFPRWDLINKQGETNGNRYEYYDKIAKEKLGCDEPLNAPDQAVQPLIQKALAKAMAARSIASFLWAATGVAIAAQKPFTEFKMPAFKNMLKELPLQLGKTLAKSVKQMWKGSNMASSVIGKSLLIATAASTVLGILNVKRGFKIDTKHSESKIDYKKDYVEN